MLNSLPFLGLIPWTVFFIYEGIPDLYKILGGSFGFFLLYPLFVYGHFKIKKIRKIVWIIFFNLLGLIAINYCYYLFTTIKLNRLFYVVFVSIPISWLMSGYALGIEALIRKDIKKNKIYRDFFTYVISTLVLPFYIIIFFIIGIKGNYQGLGILIALGSLIISGITLLIGINKVPIEQIDYFSEKIRQQINIKNIKKNLIISILFIIIFSSYWEIYRREWILWGETVILFLIQIIIQFKFSKIIFMPSNFEEPSFYNFPSIKNIKSVIVFLLLLFGYIFLVLKFFI